MQPPRAIRSCSAVLAAAAAIAALVAAVFGRALRGGFVWDDVTLVERNALVHSLRWVPRLFHSGFWDTSTSGVDVSDVRYYRPLISTAYALQWQLGHGAPWLFHAVSLVLHAACALLGLRWLRARIPAAPAPAVALAALVLVAHPSRTESVAWIAGSTDLWATLFLLLTAGARTPLRCAVYAALATLSKESAAALPVLLAVDAWAGAEPARRDGLRRAAAAAASVGAVFAWRLAWLPLAGPHAPGSQGLASAAARVAASLGMLATRVLRPLPAGFGFAEIAHDVHGRAVYPGASVAVGVAVGAAALAVFAAAVRSPRARPWAADVAWALLAAAPALNVVARNMPDLVSDRMLYTPLLGVVALMVRALAALGVRSLRSAVALGVAMALPVAVGAVATAGHAADFRDEATLWRYEVAAFPGQPRALVALATVEVSARRFDGAIEHIRAGLAASARRHSRDGQMDLALLTARLLLLRVPDADQEGLRSVRAFLDATVDASAPVARLDASGVRLDVRMWPGESSIVAGLRDGWQAPRALAALRTLDLADAARRYGALVDTLPTDVDALLGLGRALAALRRWDDADRVAVRAAALDPRGARLAAALRGATCSGARAPTADALVLARCFLSVELYELARRTALTAGHPPPTPELADVLLDADLADGLAGRARARVVRDGARFPAWARVWQERVAGAPRRP